MSWSLQTLFVFLVLFLNAQLLDKKDMFSKCKSHQMTLSCFILPGVVEANIFFHILLIFDRKKLHKS